MGTIASEPSEERSEYKNSLIDYLFNVGTPEVTKEQRIAITERCDDSDYIPKVKDAGKVVVNADGSRFQIMHNGLRVLVDGYYGEWVTKSISSLKGHHEPQEEKVFFEISKLFRPGTTMIELGSYWAYYSLWFRQVVKDGTSICCEPDPHNIEIGRKNFAINHISSAQFLPYAAGCEDKKIIQFETETPGEVYDVEIRSVDSLVKEYNIECVEVLHMDVQGAELDSLIGASETIKNNKLRFVVISTHHYLISREPNIHQKCIKFIKSLGGHIIAEHDIHESFSGDGLIVASFMPIDRSLYVPVSKNRMIHNQFRSYTADLDYAFKAYEIQLQRISELKQSIEIAAGELDSTISRNKELVDIIARNDQLGVKGTSIKLAKAVYKSARFRFNEAYWSLGNLRYENTKELSSAKNRFNTAEIDVEQAITIINNSDTKNYSALMNRSTWRTALYERVQRKARKVIR